MPESAVVQQKSWLCSDLPFAPPPRHWVDPFRISAIGAARVGLPALPSETVAGGFLLNLRPRRGQESCRRALPAVVRCTACKSNRQRLDPTPHGQLALVAACRVEFSKSRPKYHFGRICWSWHGSFAKS